MMFKHVAVKGVCLFVCLVMLCTSAFADTSNFAGPFSDVPADAPYASAVSTLYEMGYFSGDENRNFNPDDTITRAEVAVVLCRLLGQENKGDTSGSSTFTDVPRTHWAFNYIAQATDEGMVNGYGDGRFGPSDPVTYEQVITMLVSAWGWGDLAMEQGGYPSGYLQVAEEFNLTDGVSQSSSDEATRSTVAMLIYNSLYN